MKRRDLLKHMGAAVPAAAMSGVARAAADTLAPGATTPIASGPFKPEWESLDKYQVPDWFRNAKFGIWAHWGPQCAPEFGDWYGRLMYEEGSDAYRNHLKKYGHPSKVGFKDVIHQWKAENWDPDGLVALYKKAGAKYFVALANHHDNFDTYNSRYQPEWNSTRIGPGRDLIAGWSKAARANGLRFGVSVHAAVALGLAEGMALRVQALRVEPFPPFAQAVGALQVAVVRNAGVRAALVCALRQLVPGPGMGRVYADAEAQAVGAGGLAPAGDQVLPRTDSGRVPLRLVAAVVQVEIVVMVG